MKKTILIACFIAFATMASAQYHHSIGFRLGKFASGLDMKHFFNANSNTGIEMFLGYTREAKGGYQSRVMMIQQLPYFDSKLQIPVDIVYGAGVNVGYFRENYFRRKGGEAVYYNPKTWNGGVCAMFGLEYDTRKFPITLGIEAIPYFNFYHPGPEWIDVACSLKMKFD